MVEIKKTKREIYLERQIRLLSDRNSKLQIHLESQREIGERIAAAVSSLDVPEPLLIAPKKSTKPVEIVLKLSDWHIGEVIRREESEGFGAFNYKVAQRRVRELIDGVVRYVRVQREAYNIQDITVLLEGDFISGDIHHELQVTNEFPVPVQAAKAGALLAEALLTLCQNFKTVHVFAVGADNHSRLVRKPQSKQKSLNSMSFLVYEVAHLMLMGQTNLTWDQPDGMKGTVKVNGFTFLVEHGDTIKAFHYTGAERTLGREALKRIFTGRKFDYWSIGHFHHPNALQGWRAFVNGSLCGTSEHDHSVGRYAPPCQVVLMVHPEHGVFTAMPFWLK